MGLKFESWVDSRELTLIYLAAKNNLELKNLSCSFSYWKADDCQAQGGYSKDRIPGGEAYEISEFFRKDMFLMNFFGCQWFERFERFEQMSPYKVQ